MLDKLEQITISCMKCGNCKSVCPTFRELGDEGISPRGRVRLIRGVSTGEVELTARYKELIGACLNCRACRDECPSGIEPNAAVLQARQHLIREQGLSAVKRAIFRGAMRGRRLFPASSKLLGLLQRASFIGKQGNPIRKAFPLVGLPQDKKIPYFALKSVLDRMPEVMLVENRKFRVAYFVGCGANLISPEIGEAVVGLLNHYGVEVVIPHKQMCCGTPIFNSGDFEGAAYFARRNISAFGRLDVDAIITACGSCGLSLKHEWKDLLGLDVPDNITSKVVDISEFLVDWLGITELGASADKSYSVTYHDPCHLARGMGIRTQPRKLLNAAAGGGYVEMTEADWCCGGAGAFSIYHPDLSRRIGDTKAENAVASSAGVVATGCPVCIIQLREMLERAGSAQRVSHTACVLWDAVNGKSRGG